MNEILDRAKRDSFYIALSYVGLGTISLFAMTSKTLMENNFTSILFMITSLLTTPVSFVGFGILWSGGENARVLMFFVQLAVFAIFWYFTYRHLSKRYDTTETKSKRRSDHTGMDAL